MLSNKDNGHDYASCIIAPANFTFECSAGQAGDGITCSDVDECDTNPCMGNSSCINNDGDFNQNAVCSNNTGDFICGNVTELEINPCD